MFGHGFSLKKYVILLLLVLSSQISFADDVSSKFTSLEVNDGQITVRTDLIEINNLKDVERAADYLKKVISQEKINLDSLPVETYQNVASDIEQTSGEVKETYFQKIRSKVGSKIQKGKDYYLSFSNKTFGLLKDAYMGPNSRAFMVISRGFFAANCIGITLGMKYDLPVQLVLGVVGSSMSALYQYNRVLISRWITSHISPNKNALGNLVPSFGKFTLLGLAYYTVYSLVAFKVFGIPFEHSQLLDLIDKTQVPDSWLPVLKLPLSVFETVILATIPQWLNEHVIALNERRSMERQPNQAAGHIVKANLHAMLVSIVALTAEITHLNVNEIVGKAMMGGLFAAGVVRYWQYETSGNLSQCKMALSNKSGSM